jgi:hypothetical protein
MPSGANDITAQLIRGMLWLLEAISFLWILLSFGSYKVIAVPLGLALTDSWPEVCAVKKRAAPVNKVRNFFM